MPCEVGLFFPSRTLVELLLRLREGWGGSILIDGRDIRGSELVELRRQIGLCAQRTELFDRSIRDNIAFSCPYASDHEIAEAARRAGVHDFIAALPRSYATRIGPDGVELSGGQRQRIALARTLLEAPPILVLDEATSMLDAAGEREFLEHNRDWLGRRSVLLITHRPSSLAVADRVVAIRDGKAAEVARESLTQVCKTARPRQRPGSRTRLRSLRDKLCVHLP